MALDTTIGGAAADSYATLAEYTARATAMGWTLGAEAANEANLRRAAIAIDTGYTHKGTKAAQAQALAWPRVNVIDGDGYSVSSGTIPQAVKDAQMEMAYLIQGGADPLATVDAVVKREKIDVIEVEYQSGSGLPSFTAVTRLLRGYVASSGQLVRA